MIVSGEADIWIESAEGGRRHVKTLISGSVFGEMGMMTGKPRRASVTAKTDVECYRLDKDGFADILRARPDIAREMSKELVARAVALEEQSATVRREKADPRRRDDVLALIRSFFGLED